MRQNDAGNRSFDSILKEKLDKSSPFDETPRPLKRQNSKISSAGTSQGLWEKLTEMGLGQLNFKTSAHYLKSKTQAKPTEKPKVQVSWKPVGLSPELTRAFEFFHSHGALITDKSTPAEIKRAFRELAKALHPDRYAQASEFEQKKHTKLFRELQAHYATLSSQKAA